MSGRVEKKIEINKETARNLAKRREEGKQISKQANSQRNRELVAKDEDMNEDRRALAGYE